MRAQLERPRVLILGASTKAALCVARSLARHGCEIAIVDWRRVPIRRSRFVARYLDLGDPQWDLRGFVDRLRAHIERTRPDELIPIHDGAIEICRAYHAEISSRVKILGLNPDAIQVYSSDKSVLLGKATEFGLPVPRGRLLRSLDDLIGLEREVSFPAVVKPVSSAVIVEGRLLTYRGRSVSSWPELVDYAREHVQNVGILVQEFVPGFGIGYNLLARDGEVFNSYIHRRLYEHDGVSTYRESLPRDAYSVDVPVRRMIREIRWTGVAMVEFRVRPDGVPVLMEMNGRFYGSAEVAVRSGLDFPWLFHQMLALGREVPRGLPLRRCRVRFLHDEVQQMPAALLRGRVREFLTWFWSLRHSFRRNDFIEDSIFTDPGFALGLYLADASRIVRKFGRRWSASLIQIRAPERLPRRAGERICFVCAGNICRSPFAEEYARLRAPEFEVFSRGTTPEPNRRPPLDAVQAAAAYGVDLGSHRSTPLGDEAADPDTLLLAADRSVHQILRSRGIPAERIRFYGPREIRDPYGKGPDAFQDAYREIAASLDELFRRDGGTSPGRMVDTP